MAILKSAINHQQKYYKIQTDPVCNNKKTYNWQKVNSKWILKLLKKAV